MKYFLIISLLLCLNLNLKAQMEVRDPHVKRQLESMVFKVWKKNHFRPKWYYWLFHNRYRNGPDRRTIKQLAPTLAALKYNHEVSEEQQLDTDTVFQQYLMQDLNIQLAAQYHLHFKPVHDRLNQQLDRLRQEAEQSKVPLEIINRFEFDRQRLNQQVEIIREGYLPQGISSKAFSEIFRDLEALVGSYRKFLHLFSINQKYAG